MGDFTQGWLRAITWAKKKNSSRALLYNNFICWSPIESSPIAKLLIDVDLKVEKSTRCCHTWFSMLFAFFFFFFLFNYNLGLLERDKVNRLE